MLLQKKECKRMIGAIKHLCSAEYRMLSHLESNGQR